MADETANQKAYRRKLERLARHVRLPSNLTANPARANRFRDPATGEVFNRNSDLGAKMPQPAETLIRAATTRPNSFDPETRTVSAVIATAHPVQRRDARGGYFEVLTADTLDLSAVEGLPVLDSHRTSTVRDQLGRVRSIAREGDSVVAVLELTAAEDAAPVVQRIADGTVSGVSIGYRVAGWTEKSTPQGRVKSPTGWRLTEVTLTSNPADPTARLRHKENEMPEDLTPSAEEAERTRRSEIRTLVRTAGLDPTVADDLIDSEADMNAAKAAVFDAMQSRSRNTPTIRVHGSSEDPAVAMTRRADALAYRMAGGELPEASREFANMGLRDLANDSLTRSGESVRGLSADELFTRAANGTSDFPLVVSNAMGKVALDAYRAAESPLKGLARQRTLPNFKDSTLIRLGEMGRLEELAEHGEFTHTSQGELGETMSLKTFGRAINLSRKLLVNDDLNLLGDMTAALGAAAAQTEADELVATFTGNPKLSDGTAVFAAGRGNMAASGAALSETTLDAARKAMRVVKGLDGSTIIGVAPRYLVVGPELETTAEKLLASIYAPTTDDVQPIRLKLVVEPRVTGTGWYVMADPASVPSLQFAYLSSAQGVQIQRQEAWTTLGMQFRAYLDFGTSWADWRGAYFNEGA